MAKTAAKKRPPARATATARSAPKKSRPAAKKPAVAKPVKGKLRPAARQVKPLGSKKVAKKVAKPSKPAKAVRKPTAMKKASRAKQVKPPIKKAATSAVKQAVIAVKSAAKAVVAAVKPPSNGSVKHKPVAVLAAKSVAAVKPAVKTTATRSEPVLIPDSRVATNLKPRKNQAGLGVKELENFRGLLLEKRREILGDMHSMENEALGYNGKSASPVNVTDMGTDNYEQEFTLGLVEKDRVLLREINHALAKIQNGAYGVCEGTGNAIGKPRLEVQPWARFSIEFARLRERNGMGIR